VGPGSESVSPALSLSKGHADVLARYVGTFVDELVACGLEDVCLCPGSRSAPLALMFARHPRVKVWTHLDERSCAYFALGMAKARADKPVAILSTSGTAAVNFAPAVVEAFHACVPLLVLTADRPPELREVGANQTIDQVRLYGSAAKWFVDLPLPEASVDVVHVGGLREPQRLGCRLLVREDREVLLHRLAVDDDLPGAGAQAHARHRFLAATGGLDQRLRQRDS